MPSHSLIRGRQICFVRWQKINSVARRYASVGAGMNTKESGAASLGSTPAPRLLASDNGWRPIETAPRDGTAVLALYDNNAYYQHVVVFYTGAKTYEWEAEMGHNAFPECRLAYWMPLPEPPK